MFFDADLGHGMFALLLGWGVKRTFFLAPAFGVAYY